MAFSPVSLPIQEILLTNFVTDIATISNANDLLLQDKLEDLLNNLEIDTNTLTIGTDNPINYVRAQSYIIQDTGLTFQTGSPAQIIARLEKNGSNESVLTVDRINVNVASDHDDITVNTVTVNDGLTADGPAVFNAPLQFNSAVVESKETLILDVTKVLTSGEARLTLSSTSRKNIFVKLRVSTAPDLDPVYDGAGTFLVNTLDLYIDFDQNNPPAENSAFSIYLVDVVENQTQTSVVSFLNVPSSPALHFRGGDNLSVTPNATIELHDSPGGLNVGINPASTTAYSKYGNNLSLLYIIDENTADRLVITSTVGLEFFP
jgi:hypothetical protein